MAQDIDFSQRYAQGNIPWDSGKPSEELLRVLDAAKLTGKTALEIGCGTGTNAIELARRGFEVTAVDCVEQAISIARGKASEAKVNLDFRTADVLTQELGGPYDVLFDRGVYHALRMADLAKFQNMLKRVSRRGSWYLSLAGNAKETKSENGPPVVTEQEIRGELGSLFDIVELRQFRFWTNQPGFRPLAWSILMRRK
jgi:cyclopropane fatty-acyl-phospholipid synthase-like methyltransferase